MIGIFACIILCAVGHAIRDGYPATGSTHAARGLGGLLCILGGFLATTDWHGALLGAAVYAGFYADAQHGEGQRSRGWLDVPPLIVSGITSLLPLAAVVGWLYEPWLAALGF